MNLTWEQLREARIKQKEYPRRCSGDESTRSFIGKYDPRSLCTPLLAKLRSEVAERERRKLYSKLVQLLSEYQRTK